MKELILAAINQNVDYIHFIIGLLTISLAFFLLVFSNQRKYWMSEDHLIFFIIYLGVIGLAVWIDLILRTFTGNPLFETIHSLFYLVAYLALYEFGRRMLFCQKKNMTLFLYLFPLLFFFFPAPLSLLSDYLEGFGSLMAGIGIFIWANKQSLSGEYKIFLFKFVPLLFIFHSLLHFLGWIQGDTSHWRHGIEWGLSILIAILFLYEIIRIEILDPLEMQLKSLKVKVLKFFLLVFFLLTIAGFYLDGYIKEYQWQIEKEVLERRLEEIPIPIDFNRHHQLLTAENDETCREIYKAIRQQLIDIVHQRALILNMYTLYIEKEHFLYGVDTKVPFDQVNDQIGKPYADSNIGMNELIKRNFFISDEITKEQNQYIIKAYIPLFNQQNDIELIVGVDFTANKILNNIQLVGILSKLFLFIIFLLILGVGYTYYIHRREMAWRYNHTKILSSIGDMVGVFDQTGKIIFANKAAYRIVGETINIDLQKANIKNYLDERGKNEFRRLLRDLGKNQVHYAEFNILTTENKTVPVFVSIAYLKYDENPLYVFTGMNISEQKHREAEIQLHFENTLALLATVIDAKDGYTARHSSNVSHYAKMIAQEMGFPEEKVKEIGIAALIHDIGKIAIPDQVLKKPTQLTDEEWKMMKEHSNYGKQILEKAGKTFEYLIPYVYYHHERYDGKGYPTNMKEPPVEICIITVADAFDAMTSDRAYRKGMPLKKAKEELLRYSETQFHPDVVQAFLNCLEREDIQEMKNKNSSSF